MSWKDNLLDASFRGVAFDCVATTDSAPHALVEHAYPYVDGADVEDMGRKARRISIQAVFFGPDYETQLQAFLAALEGKDNTLPPADAANGGWLQHPVFGMLFCQVEDARVAHNADDVDEAKVEVVFVESTPSAPFFTQQLASQKADASGQHGDTAISSVSDRAANIIGAIQAVNPLNSLDRLRQTLMGPILNITAGAGLVLSGLDPLQYPRAWGNDVASIAGNILDVRDWTVSARQQWASIQSDFNAFRALGTPSSTPPAQLSPSTPPTEQQGEAVVAATIQVVVQASIAQGCALLLAAEMTTPTLSPSDVEAMANTARTGLETAILQVKAIFSLEDAGPICDALRYQALALQEAAAAVIAAAAPLIQRAITVPGNFRLQAHFWYGDSDRATELWLLNGARSPFTLPGDVVNAYAN